MRPEIPQLHYVIDNEDILTSVEAKYVLAGDGFEAHSYELAQAVGSNLMDFILGEPTRAFWAAVFDKVRRARNPFEVSYRCDAHDLKRFMKVRVADVGNGSLSLAHFVLRTEPLPVPLRFSSHVGAESTRCSICNDVRHGGAWVRPEIAWGQGLLKTGSVNLVNYAVCGSCRDMAPPH